MAAYDPAGTITPAGIVEDGRQEGDSETEEATWARADASGR